MDDWNTSFLLGWPIFICKLLVLGRVSLKFFTSKSQQKFQHHIPAVETTIPAVETTIPAVETTVPCPIHQRSERRLPRMLYVAR